MGRFHTFNSRHHELATRSFSSAGAPATQTVPGEAVPEPPAPEDRASFAVQSYRHARRLVILVIGSTVLLAGVAMLVLPGPAFIVIPLGLAILGIEFAWARRLLRKVRGAAESVFRTK